MKTSVSFIHPVFKMVVAHGEFVQQQGGGKSLVIRAILNPRNKDIQNSFSAQELEKVEALLKENYKAAAFESYDGEDCELEF